MAILNWRTSDLVFSELSGLTSSTQTERVPPLVAEAVERVERAISLAETQGKKGLVSDLHLRRKLYLNGRPYRETRP